ncbi:PAS domain-containing sensor histidine kinase [uncultured Aquimarina sp.]|uniref:sensor histidine kinase n=1 Tax=uncultured Aquimarina sp. TaxID=575652 RepID=UPI002626A5EF|nr:PAS domain-containing sensor histidine kinase [uncultured Aquimarina sp.]
MKDNLESPYKFNELTFQVMVDASPSALILVNDEGKIAYVNHYTEKLFQYSRSEIIGQKVEVLMPARFERYHPGFVQSFFQTPQFRRMGEGRELFALKKDKSEFPVEIGLNPIVTMNGNMVLASIIDISERKKAEERFRLVVESAPSAMVLVNKKGEIVLVNTQTEKLFGYHRGDLIGQKIELLIPDEIKKQHPKYRKEFNKNPQTRAMGASRDLFAINRDGKKFQVEIGLNPLDTFDGKMVLASIIDITERKNNEENTRRYTKKLEAKNKELEQFSYIASHDLQEPLRSITGLTQILKEDHQGQLDAEAQNILSYLQESTNRMNELIKGLLDYGRLGKKSVVEEINCNELIDTVLKDMKISIEESNTSIEVEQLPVLFGYKLELRLLFQNLISNAIKFKRNTTNPNITISAKKKTPGWLFSIADNGIGIDMKFKEKIFTIFQQLNPKELYKGTGIGLSHCKKIVDLHDGDIWVESQLDEGSTFYFTINTKVPK